MNTRQKTKDGTYINRHSSLHFTNFSKFRLQSTIGSSGFLGKCAEHVVRRTVLAVACSKRSASSRSSVMVEKIDVSVRYNLEKTRSDSDIVTISVPTISTHHSVDVWKLDTASATTAECCRSIVRGLFCCSRCPLLTPENILAAKISWTMGAGRPASIRL